MNRTSASSRRARGVPLLVLAGTGALLASGVLAAAPSHAAVSCSVQYTVSSQWSGGFIADVTLTNTGDALSGWQLVWGNGSGQSVTSAWNATVAQSGSTVTAANVAYNAALAGGGTVTFGVQGTFSGSNPVPSSFALNGVGCGGGSGGSATTTSTTRPGTTSTTHPDVDQDVDQHPDVDHDPHHNPHLDPDHDHLDVVRRGRRRHERARGARLRDPERRHQRRPRRRDGDRQHPGRPAHPGPRRGHPDRPGERQLQLLGRRHGELEQDHPGGRRELRPDRLRPADQRRGQRDRPEPEDREGAGRQRQRRRDPHRPLDPPVDRPQRPVQRHQPRHRLLRRPARHHPRLRLRDGVLEQAARPHQVLADRPQ